MSGRLSDTQDEKESFPHIYTDKHFEIGLTKNLAFHPVRKTPVKIMRRVP